VATAELLKGEIEAIPLPDDAVAAIDVVMSDCVTGARFPVRLLAVPKSVLSRG
jgi:hypothetical protein